jgi:hypothetical protein
MSIRLTVFNLVMISLFVSCSVRKASQLEIEIDSLAKEVELRNNLVLAMNSTSGFLDSMYNVDSYDSSSTHMQGYIEWIRLLNNNLRDSHGNLVEIKSKLTSTQDEALAYKLMVMALQDEVSIRDGEIEEINGTMIKNVGQHKGEVYRMKAALSDRDRELEKLQKVINEMKKLEEADAYFNRAQKIEEKARRIIFAPRKKKENMKEALELYQKAFVLGKLEASRKITLLRKSVHGYK